MYLVIKTATPNNLIQLGETYNTIQFLTMSCTYNQTKLRSL